MAKEKEKVKKVLIEKLLASYFEGKTYKNNRIHRVNVNKTDYFMIITDSGFEIYFASKKILDNVEVLDKVELKHSFSWGDFESVKVDKFAISTLYEFNTGFNIKVSASNDLTEALKTNGIIVNILERKWYNKILGFRSKKKWKMVVASIGYIFILFVIIGMFANGNNTTQQATSTAVSTNSNSSDVSTSNSSESSTSNSKDASTSNSKDVSTNNSKDVAVTQKQAQPQTPQQKLQTAVTNAIGEKSNRNGQKLTGLTIDGTGNIIVKFKIDDNLTSNMIAVGAEDDIVKILKNIKDTNVDYKTVTTLGSFSMQDKFGNSSEDTVINIGFSKDTVNKINFDNFDFKNIYSIADTTVFVHPDFIAK